jgi:hypothetical protein
VLHVSELSFALSKFCLFTWCAAFLVEKSCCCLKSLVVCFLCCGLKLLAKYYNCWYCCHTSCTALQASNNVGDVLFCSLTRQKVFLGLSAKSSDFMITPRQEIGGPLPCYVLGRPLFHFPPRPERKQKVLNSNAIGTLATKMRMVVVVGAGDQKCDKCR